MSRCPGHGTVELVADEDVLGWELCCASPAEHKAKCWMVCEQPERPLDLHGLFDNDCPACQRAWVILGCPIPHEMLAANEARP